MTFSKKWGALLLTALLLVTVGCGSTNQGTDPATNTKQTGEAPVVGKPAPDFTLNKMGSESVTLSNLRGKRVILNFWASWCKPCKTEMPDLKEVARKHEEKVLTYGINLTADDQQELAEKMILELGLTFPNLFDTDGSVGKAYRIISVPTTLVIDENGIIAERIDGQLSRQAIEDLYNRQLAKPAAK
jgi:peroxiredoxin